MDAIGFVVDFEKFQFFLSRQIAVPVLNLPGVQFGIHCEHFGIKVNIRERIKHLIEIVTSVHWIDVRTVDDDAHAVYGLQPALRVVSWSRFVVLVWIISLTVEAVDVTAVKAKIKCEFVSIVARLQWTRAVEILRVLNYCRNMVQSLEM